ncbi:ATP-dependent DNA ligase [soil metagenome]
MKEFASLFAQLDQTNKTSDKIYILKNYFSRASDEDKLWALALFTHKRPRKQINSNLLRRWTAEVSEIPEWLFDESYLVVGDLAETMSLLLPFPGQTQDYSLSWWMQFLISLSDLPEPEKKEKIIQAWDMLDQQERFVLTKLMTGSFRIGVSQSLVVRALSEVTAVDKQVLAHRIMGKWDPTRVQFEDLIYHHNEEDNLSRPYPFFLAHPIDASPGKLGAPEEWQAEWKWDGIRSQFIKRKNEIYIWSRGEDLITDKFPELHNISGIIPDGTVLDGEILPYKNNKPLPFGLLQTRIGRKNLTKKNLEEAPVVVMVYDLLEWEGKDIREEPLAERRTILENIASQNQQVREFIISPTVKFNSWEQLKNEREKSRANLAEGFMLKRKNSSYQVGRKRGDWWKWKVEPLTIEGVLVYAQKGSGRRADLYTDYTFAVWDQDQLIPFAKAYSGLTDKELKQIDSFVKRNTKEKFGPVRTVIPKLVFEIAFEGIQSSGRHKSGVAVRFPRISRWRNDKKVEDANSLTDLKALLFNP